MSDDRQPDLEGKVNYWSLRSSEGDKYYHRKGIPPDVRKHVHEKDNYTCIYCGKKPKHPHCDHIIPVVSGGTNNACNLGTSCKSCNFKKGGKSLHDFLVHCANKKKGIKRADIFRRHEERKAAEIKKAKNAQKEG